jgi:hypothetical protein
VTIVSAEPAITIRYTKDGSTPTSTHGTIYSGPLKISATTTLKAMAYRTGFRDSGVATAAFVILPPRTLNLEAENLTFVPSGAVARILKDHDASNEKWIELAADGIGDSITFTLHAIPAELYQLKLLWKSDDDRGILCLKVDGKPVGSTLDQYAAGSSFRTTVFGSVYLAEGDHVIQLVVTGRRRGSHGFTVSADKFTLVGQ